MLGIVATAAATGSVTSCARRAWSHTAEADVARAAPEPATVPAGARVIDQATGRLFTALPSRGNIVCSPYSIVLALAMALNGAEGATAKEMRDLLRTPQRARLNADLNAVTQSVTGIAGPLGDGDDDVEIVLDVVNAMFGQKDVTWEQPFLEALARYYGAGVQLADFAGDPEGERGAINSWVSGATDDAISELLPLGSITADTRLALVNAVHLKAPWADQFSVDDTMQEAFHPSADETLTVPMMHQTYTDAEVASEDGWTAARLPFAGGRLAMALVLPDPGRDDVVDLHLRVHGTSALLAGLRGNTRLELSMPRFSISFGTPLRDLLTGLGMGSAFTNAADFGGISREVALRISQVFHQAQIDVDEQGAEASAATAVTMSVTSVRPPDTTVSLTLDRPFLFVVEDAKTATPLFIGRVLRPGGS